MSLVSAANELRRTVASTRRVRLLFLRRGFPRLRVFGRSALAAWVRSRLASGELTLIDEVTLDIDGSWDNYRFPPPESS